MPTKGCDLENERVLTRAYCTYMRMNGVQLPFIPPSTQRTLAGQPVQYDCTLCQDPYKVCTYVSSLTPCLHAGVGLLHSDSDCDSHPPHRLPYASLAAARELVRLRTSDQVNRGHSLRGRGVHASRALCPALCVSCHHLRTVLPAPIRGTSLVCRPHVATQAPSFVYMSARACNGCIRVRRLHPLKDDHPRGCNRRTEAAHGVRCRSLRPA